MKGLILWSSLVLWQVSEISNEGVPPNAVMVISTLKSTDPWLEEMRKALRGRWWTRLVVERNLDGMLVWWLFDFVSNVQKNSFRDYWRQDWEMTWTWSRGGPGELIKFKKRRLIRNDWWRKQLGRDVGPKSSCDLFRFFFFYKKTRLISSTCPCLRQSSLYELHLEGCCPEAHGEEITGAGNSAERLGDKFLLQHIFNDRKESRKWRLSFLRHNLH